MPVGVCPYNMIFRPSTLENTPYNSITSVAFGTTRVT
ncbi:MAG: hypothetical protein ACI9OJ_002758, partial [Myxococcota bacterium]